MEDRRQLMADRRQLMADRRRLMAQVRHIRTKRKKARQMCSRAPKSVKVRQIRPQSAEPANPFCTRLMRRRFLSSPTIIPSRPHTLEDFAVCAQSLNSDQ